MPEKKAGGIWGVLTKERCDADKPLGAFGSGICFLIIAALAVGWLVLGAGMCFEHAPKALVAWKEYNTPKLSNKEKAELRKLALEEQRQVVLQEQHLETSRKLAHSKAELDSVLRSLKPLKPGWNYTSVFLMALKDRYKVIEELRAEMTTIRTDMRRSAK